MTKKELLEEARETFRENWDVRDGRKVPEPHDLKLTNDAVRIEATVLYADMADSTGLVKRFKAEFAAEIYKAYLRGVSRIIQKNGGEITAFDGDRAMAVFAGDAKDTSAAKTALNINAFVKALNSEIQASYPSTTFVLAQTVGIDTGVLFVARTGIRNNNDLVWVGPAANNAAKLCGVGGVGGPSRITETVFSRLREEAKFGGNPKKNMWEKMMWDEMGLVIYGSDWWWEF